jgi:hypothetical protein
MKSALQSASGHHGGHHHHPHAAGSSGAGEPAGATANTDPLLQALNAQTAPTLLTGAGSTSPYDLFDQLIQRQNFSSATPAALSV